MKILDVIEGHYLLISAYHCNRIIKIDSTGQQHISYPKPMGIGVGDETVAIAAKTGIWLCGHDLKPHTYHVTGETQTHDVSLIAERVYFVNTRDNCLSLLSTYKPPKHHPLWYADSGCADDFFHLNGMTDNMDVVTMLSEEGDWRENKLHAGALWSVDYGHLIGGLCMPHSPRYDADGKLWYLESGRGWLCGWSGLLKVELPGYTRGLCFHEGYAFVCTSHGRESDFEGVPILKGETQCGVHMVNVQSGEIEDSLILDDPVRELYSVKVVKQP